MLRRFVQQLTLRTARAPIQVIELPCLCKPSLEAIALRPASITDISSTALEQISRRLPRSWSMLTRADLLHVFAATVAHNLKPYGAGCPSQQYSDLLSSSHLDCSNFGLLTYYLSCELLSERERKSLSFVGWDGGTVGNHQMLFLSENEKTAHFAIDPTFGIACAASFNDIASGKPIPPEAIAIVGATPQLDPTRAAFVAALLEGQFKPTNLLYFFPTAQDYLTRYGNPFDWPTPAVSILRDRYASRS